MSSSRISNKFLFNANWYNYPRNTSSDKSNEISQTGWEYYKVVASADYLSRSLSLFLSFSLFFFPLLIRPKASKRLVSFGTGTNGLVIDWKENYVRTGRVAKGRNIRKKNKRKRTRTARFRMARGGKSRFHSCTRPISRTPAGSVYFVSFYITRYPRDLDSIYFLLALRHECTGPIFDVGGRIFSGRNDRWIFLYFPFPRRHLFLRRSILFPPGNSCFV